MDYNSYKQQRAKELGGAALSANDMRAMQNNLPNDYRNYVMQQNGGVLSNSDLQAINKMINPQYQMPTYSDIYNGILSVLGRQ